MAEYEVAQVLLKVAQKVSTAVLSNNVYFKIAQKVSTYYAYFWK